MGTLPGLLVRDAAVRLSVPGEVAGRAVALPAFAADVVVLTTDATRGASVGRTWAAVRRSADDGRLLHQLSDYRD